MEVVWVALITATGATIQIYLNSRQNSRRDRFEQERAVRAMELEQTREQEINERAARDREVAAFSRCLQAAGFYLSAEERVRQFGRSATYLAPAIEAYSEVLMAWTEAVLVAKPSHRGELARSITDLRGWLPEGGNVAVINAVANLVDVTSGESR